MSEPTVVTRSFAEVLRTSTTPLIIETQKGATPGHQRLPWQMSMGNMAFGGMPTLDMLEAVIRYPYVVAKSTDDFVRAQLLHGVRVPMTPAASYSEATAEELAGFTQGELPKSAKHAIDVKVARAMAIASYFGYERVNPISTDAVRISERIHPDWRMGGLDRITSATPSLSNLPKDKRKQFAAGHQRTWHYLGWVLPELFLLLHLTETVNGAVPTMFRQSLYEDPHGTLANVFRCDVHEVPRRLADVLKPSVFSPDFEAFIASMPEFKDWLGKPWKGEGWPPPKLLLFDAPFNEKDVKWPGHYLKQNVALMLKFTIASMFNSLELQFPQWASLTSVIPMYEGIYYQLSVAGHEAGEVAPPLEQQQDHARAATVLAANAWSLLTNGGGAVKIETKIGPTWGDMYAVPKPEMVE